MDKKPFVVTARYGKSIPGWFYLVYGKSEERAIEKAQRYVAGAGAEATGVRPAMERDIVDFNANFPRAILK